MTRLYFTDGAIAYLKVTNEINQWADVPPSDLLISYGHRISHIYSIFLTNERAILVGKRLWVHLIDVAQQVSIPNLECWPNTLAVTTQTSILQGIDIGFRNRFPPWVFDISGSGMLFPRCSCCVHVINLSCDAVIGLAWCPDHPNDALLKEFSSLTTHLLLNMKYFEVVVLKFSTNLFPPHFRYWWYPTPGGRSGTPQNIDLSGHCSGVVFHRSVHLRNVFWGCRYKRANTILSRMRVLQCDCTPQLNGFGNLERRDVKRRRWDSLAYRSQNLRRVNNRSQQLNWTCYPSMK